MSSENEYEYCPRCDANLTLQKGYSNDLPYWVCKGCGEMLINPAVDAPDDVAWICDECGAMLNVQEGFENNNGEWKCTCCGFVNDIDEKNLYDTEEAYEADLSSPYKGLSDDEVLYLSSLREEEAIDGRGHVVLVVDPDTGAKYIRKYLTVYDKSIYEHLKANPVEHMPRIQYLAEGSNCLVVLEEYIEGTTVEELVREGSISKSEALGIVRSIAGVLVTLHNSPSPILHRDIKPSNVIVTDSGEVFLLDMNAAKWYAPDKLDKTDFFGTLYYAAPEQLGYGLTHASAKSDVYAVGVLLNVMLTGDIPKHKRAEGEAWSVIERCISLDPEGRYNADELLAALCALEDGET